MFQVKLVEWPALERGLVEKNLKSLGGLRVYLNGFFVVSRWPGYGLLRDWD